MTKVLFITHTPPWPIANGGHQRTNLLLRALCSFAEVDFVLLPRSVRRYSEDELALLRRDFGLLEFVRPSPWGKQWPWRLARPLWPMAVDILAKRWGRGDADYTPDAGVTEWLGEQVRDRGYDLIVGRYSQPTIRSGALEFAPTIVDVDDVDTDRLGTELEMPGVNAWRRKLLKRKLDMVARALPGYLAQAAHLWVCSETDRRLLGPDRATVLPNIPFVGPETRAIAPCPPNPRSRTVLIVGSLKYLVNERAIDRFLRNVWPEVHSACPDAVFRIVGAGMTSAEQRRWGRVAGVQPIGFVENLRAEYAGAAFSVAPLFEGGGTKIKVLESLAFGRTCLLTKHAQRGFEHMLRHEESFWVAEDDEGLAQGCIALLQDPDLPVTLAETGQRLVSEHFTFDEFRRIVKQTAEAVGVGHKGGVTRRSADARTALSVSQ